MNTREKVLKEALKCVNGEREKQYGSPEDNFRRIADLWSTYLTSLFEDEKIVVDIDPIDVAKMMILFKIAQSNGDKDKLDNYVDILGYGACAAEIFENSEQHTSSCDDIVYVGVQGQKYAFKRYQKEEVKDDIQLADECKECDYAEKCMGTGVCLKETEKECVKNGESILDNFADHVNARVRKENKQDNGQKDTCNHAAYMPKGAIEIHKFVEDNKLSMDFDFEKSPKGRDIFNDAARAFIAGIGNSNVKITTFEAPKDWYLYDVFMNETGQIIVRFNTRKTKELTGIPCCDECLYGTQGATDDPCNKCLCDIHHKPFFILKREDSK